MVNIEKPDFENMSNNKKYFIIWLWIFIIVIIIFILFVSGWSEKEWNTNNSTKWTVNIWTVWESDQKFIGFINKYKTENWLKSVVFTVRNFSNYETYYYALTSAFLNDKAPDIFVINNNDLSEKTFYTKILWLTSNDISLSDFKKNFSSIFSKDLIKTENLEIDWKAKELSYLIWVPLGYESIWLFYNSKLLRWLSVNIAKNITSWSGINNIIDELEEYDNSIIAIGLWVWKQITYSNDILASLIIQDWSSTVSSSQTTKTIANYLNYNNKWINFENTKTDESDIELFRKSKLAIILWYPRILWQIWKMRDKNNVLASYFPRISNTKNDLFINYNYFVINIESKNTEIAKKLLAYFASEDWAEDYFDDANDYLIPAQPSLISEFWEDKINNNFWVTFSEIIYKPYILKSFDKKISFVYDNGIKEVLDSKLYQITARALIKRLNTLSNVY